MSTLLAIGMDLAAYSPYPGTAAEFLQRSPLSRNMNASETTPASTPAPSSVSARYSSDEDVPLGGYTVLMAAFGGALIALLASQSRTRGSSGKISSADLLLMGVATHRLTRAISRDWVTAPLRAPFTKYVESAGEGEVEETARGTGIQKATGQLLTCKFCSGPWVAMGLVSVFLFRPSAARTIASIFSVSAVSDFLHKAYSRVQK